ncbi:MAG: hypothetical protein EHM24_16230 [Acidobacteria bacterium]|nr:MAG: hypothetical protein EHM24_16230 [Acidobacteriota bacterium]
MHQRSPFVAVLLAVAASLSAGAAGRSQTAGEKESFTAVAIANNNLGSGAGTVLIDITRWSPEAERSRLVGVLMEKGQEALLDELRDAPPAGTIRTPATLAYDLRYAQQTPTEDGGRDILLLTDRPIGFWEATARPRSIEYPFTVIQMRIDGDGKGTGTITLATKIAGAANVIVLEDLASSPIRLTEIQVQKGPE